MLIRILAGAALLAASSAMGGCASDGDFLGSSLTTASIEPTVKSDRVDPQCVALMSKIDALRKEGTPGRIEKISSGKTSTTVVKREALQRMTELDKTNAEFQSRCSTLASGQQAATTATVTGAAKQTAVKTVAKSANSAETSAQ